MDNIKSKLDAITEQLSPHERTIFETYCHDGLRELILKETVSNAIKWIEQIATGFVQTEKNERVKWRAVADGLKEENDGLRKLAVENKIQLKRDAVIDVRAIDSMHKNFLGFYSKLRDSKNTLTAVKKRRTAYDKVVRPFFMRLADAELARRELTGDGANGLVLDAAAQEVASLEKNGAGLPVPSLDELKPGGVILHPDLWPNYSAELVEYFRKVSKVGASYAEDLSTLLCSPTVGFFQWIVRTGNGSGVFVWPSDDVKRPKVDRIGSVRSLTPELVESFCRDEKNLNMAMTIAMLYFFGQRPQRIVELCVSDLLLHKDVERASLPVDSAVSEGLGEGGEFLKPLFSGLGLDWRLSLPPLDEEDSAIPKWMREKRMPPTCLLSDGFSLILFLVSKRLRFRRGHGQLPSRSHKPNYSLRLVTDGRRSVTETPHRRPKELLGLGAEDIIRAGLYHSIRRSLEKSGSEIPVEILYSQVAGKRSKKLVAEISAQAIKDHENWKPTSASSGERPLRLAPRIPRQEVDKFRDGDGPKKEDVATVVPIFGSQTEEIERYGRPLTESERAAARIIDRARDGNKETQNSEPTT